MKKFFNINKIVRSLIGADILFLSAFGLIAPVFAVFITEQIKGGDVKIIGFAAGIYWILRAILQVPIGRFLDKTEGEKDDFYFLIIGYILATLVPFGYIFSSLPWHIYLLAVVNALGMAMAYPAWCAIFTRHIDKGREALEWGSYGTAVDLGIGAAGAIGGLLVSKFGFNLVFLFVGIIALVGGLLPILIYKHITPRKNILSFIYKIHRPF